MNMCVVLIVVVSLSVIFCFSFNSMINCKVNNLSRRVELNSIHTNRNLCELTESLNKSFEYLDDCNVILKKLMNDNIRTLKNILCNIEIDKNSMLDILKNKLDSIDEHIDLNDLYNHIDNLNIKYKSIELSDTILYDNIIKLNKLISLALLNNNINLLTGDYNSLSVTNYETLSTKGDINNPSILNTRRISINGSTFYMPEFNRYNTFDVIYIDILSPSIINKTRTSMNQDYNGSSNTTVIFVLYESKWMFLTTIKN